MRVHNYSLFKKMFKLFVILCTIEIVCTEQPTVRTSYGDLAGYVLQNTAVFLGVPFAKPPVGNLRFRVRYRVFLKWRPTGRLPKRLIDSPWELSKNLNGVHFRKLYALTRFPELQAEEGEYCMHNFESS